ncbi:cytochrome c [Nakamurella sp. PAMC28650]|uniref:cytochrome bc1 complex diheme cytochrome c subunit n=1 Tax=Nakamurella sp. PAMC28650 TaxID=2762325 RepID=UPI00164DCA79|nr:cytochrome c [Nakamurella sp. PAMC28650]QNK79615.1 c-type cytochrome [Nakamurella sp. PAMC28650]
MTRRSKAARRISGGLALLFALVAMGFAYSALTPAPQAAASAATSSAADIAKGKEIYQTSCIVCHGSNLQGVLTRGPSLIGVGQAATYFQVSTGRMPAVANGAQNPRKQPSYTEQQITYLSAYIEANGGGPAVPGGSLQNVADVSKGGELYRLNCASCHNFTGQGGALSQGKYAPSLDQATDQQIYAAMLSGPESMPKFSDGQITPNQKKAIITYVQNNKQSASPGGYALGGFGPAPEGLIAFLVGMGAIVALTLWMGARA